MFIAFSNVSLLQCVSIQSSDCTTVLLSTVCVTLRWRPEQVLKWSHHRRWSLPAPWVGGFSALVICAPVFHTLLWPFYHTLHFGFGLGEDVFCSALAGWLWKNDDVENRRWRWQVCWWLRIKLLWGHPMLQGTLLNSNRKSTQIHKYKYTNTP